MTLSAVLIAPAEILPAADAAAQALGWGPGTFAIALSADGGAITHHACRADVTPEEQAHFEALEGLIVNISTDLWGAAHAAAAFAALGLAQIATQD